MIGRITRGKDFKSLLARLLYHKKASFLASNIKLDRDCSFYVPQERYLVHQYAYLFKKVADLKPELKLPVYHVSLSLPPGEHLSDSEWIEVGKRYLKETGFQDCQYVLLRYQEQKNKERCHIISNLVTRDGKVVNTWGNYYQSQLAIRPIELDYHLTEVLNSWEVRAASNNSKAKFSSRDQS